MPELKLIDEQNAKAVYVAHSPLPGRNALSGENALLTITLAAEPRPSRPSFDYVHWSYDAAPTGGILTVSDGDWTETIYITSGGPGFLPFDGGSFRENADVTITLTAGGAGVNGSLAVIGARYN